MSVGASALKILEFEKNGSLRSNQTAHDTDDQTFVTYVDLFNDVAGRRRKRPGKGSPKGATAAGAITALHEFNRIDETTQVVTQYIFRSFLTKIQKSTNGGVSWNDCVIPFTPTSAAQWVFKNFNNRCFATNGVDHFIYFDGSTGPVDGREWYYVGVDAPVAALGYSALTATEYSTGTVTTIEGSKAIVGAGTTFVAGDVGKSIDIAGVRYQIATFTDATHITLLTSYKKTGAAGVTYTIYRGLMDWSEPPKYAMAYHNTRTGHYSNIGPVLQISEKDQVGRTPTITGIPHSQTAYRNGYDKIQMFRPAKNGTTLVAISGGEINNADDNATTTFPETSLTCLDINLLDLEAPQVLARRPLDIDGSTNPPPFTTIGEFNGRLFAYCARRSLLFFSGALEDSRFLRVEECWPEEYSFRCTEGKGMIEIGAGDDGDQLIVHTAFGDRAVVGFDPLSYRLRRIETRKTEGFQGGSVIVDGKLVELHRDKRLIDYGAGKDLGIDFQDKLDACSAANFTKARLAWFSYKSRNFLFVSVPSGSGSSSNDRTLIYDYDLENHYDWSVGFSAFASVHNTTSGELELWAGTATGDIVRLMDDTVFTDAGVNLVPTVKTVVLRPFGIGGRGQLEWIEIFTSESGLFTGKIYLDEEPNITDPDAKGFSFIFSTPAAQYQTAKGKKLMFKPTKAVDFNALQIEIAFPSTSADIQVEKFLVACTAIVPNAKVEALP